MPKRKYVRKFRRTNKKRRVFKAKRGVRSRVPMPLGGFNKSKIVKFRWFAEGVLDPSGDTPALVNFHPASPWDPDPQLGGTSANNWSTWSLLYEKYCVIGSKMTVKAQPGSTQVPGSWTCLLNPRGSITPAMTKSEIMGSNLVNPFKMRDYGGNSMVNAFSRPQVATYSPRKLFRVNPSAVEGLTVNVNQNPATTPDYTYQIIAFSNNDSEAGRFTFRLVIDYVVKFTGLYPESQLAANVS